MTTLLFTLSLVSLLFSCEKPREIDDDKPRIKSVSITGIPDKDIGFISERYIINVQLPATVPAGGLKPGSQLTENTEIPEGLTLDDTVESILFCGNRLPGFSDRKGYPCTFWAARSDRYVCHDFD